MEFTLQRHSEALGGSRRHANTTGNVSDVTKAVALCHVDISRIKNVATQHVLPSVPAEAMRTHKISFSGPIAPGISRKELGSASAFNQSKIPVALESFQVDARLPSQMCTA